VRGLSRLDDREYRRRIEILKASDTLTEAADRIGVTVSATQQFSEQHYAQHERDFGLEVSDDEADRRREAIDGHDTIADAARSLDMEPNQLVMWSRRNNDDHRELDPPFEERVQALSEAETVKQAASDLGLGYSNLLGWSRDHYPMHKAEFGKGHDLGLQEGELSQVRHRMLVNAVDRAEEDAANLQREVSDIQTLLSKRGAHMGTLDHAEQFLSRLLDDLEDVRRWIHALDEDT